jgi:hypothetical protein
MTVSGKLVLPLAAVGIRANVRCNGFLVGSSVDGKPVAILRRLEPFTAAGKNLLQVELVDPGPPPPDAKEEPILTVALHIVDEGAVPYEANHIVTYAFSPGEVRETPDYQLVLSHVFATGSGKPRVWERARNVLEHDVGQVLATGLAECRRAFETGQGLAALLTLHAADHAAITDVPEAEAMNDLGADLVAAVAAGSAQVEFAATNELIAKSSFDGRVVQGRTKSGRPMIVIRRGETSTGLSPAFGLIDDKVRVLRWS